jgi:preprotein translocase subunit YajC
MFISEAFAQAAQSSATVGAPDNMVKIVFQLVLFFAIFYMLLIRPQKKKMEEQARMLNKISKGDKIVVGGIIGEVVKTVGDAELIVKIADNTEIRVLRARIQGLLEADDLKSDSKKEEKEEKKKTKAKKTKAKAKNSKASKLKDVLSEK